jgi:hypothetical protein
VEPIRFRILNGLVSASLPIASAPVGGASAVSPLFMISLILFVSANVHHLGFNVTRVLGQIDILEE